MNKIEYHTHKPKIKYYFSTPYETSRGLMWVKYMPQNSVALFDMKKYKIHSFYMKNTILPLDIIFVNKKGIVVGVLEDMKPFDETGKNVEHKSIIVIEANAGYVKKHNIVPFKTKILIPNHTLNVLRKSNKTLKNKTRRQKEKLRKTKKQIFN